MKGEGTQMQPKEMKGLSPIATDVARLFEDMEKVYREISQRAFQFFDERGRTFGKELEDWFKAESEFLRPIAIELTENETEYLLRAEVPGYTEKDIELHVEPNRVVMRGNVESKREEKQEEATVYTEISNKNFFRQVNLLKEVDPNRTIANMKEGILTVTMPKVVTPAPTKVEVKTE